MRLCIVETTPRDPSGNYLGSLISNVSNDDSIFRQVNRYAVVGGRSYLSRTRVSSSNASSVPSDAIKGQQTISDLAAASQEPILGPDLKLKSAHDLYTRGDPHSWMG